MATIFPLDRALKITPALHGSIAELGAAGVMQQAGMYSIQWVPDLSYSGSLAILCRTASATAPAAAHQPDVPFVACPYKAIYLNGTTPPTPYGFPVDNATGLPALITGSSLIQVPSNGISIAVLIGCDAGFGWLFLNRLNGPSAV